MGRIVRHEFEAEEVMAYLDGELAPARAAELAGHLEHCQECGALATRFRQLSERLLDFGAEASPERVGDVVLAQLESVEPQRGAKASREAGDLKRSKPRRAFRKPSMWGLAAATAIALLIVGVGAYRATNSSRKLGSFNLYSGAPIDTVAPKAGPAEAPASPYLEKMAPFARAKIEREPSDSLSAGADGTVGKLESPAAAGPMIAQSVSLTIVANNYADASAGIEHLATAHGGYIQTLTSDARSGTARQLSASLRLPAAQLADSLAELRKLGRVEQETRANEEVTDQYVDLQARLRSARATEQRLLQLLATRTGTLEDVLAAEQELARIREEIESMDGQRNVLQHRVSYVSVDVRLYEQYVEPLQTGSTSTTTGLHNALVDGAHNLEDGVVALLVFLFAYGPSILFWCALILIPGYFVWLRVRARRRIRE
jgi:Domain of unknown function (DUF4349)/Putative zinc-finger